MSNQFNNTNTRRLCTIAMLCAIALILGMLSIRIGLGIKISFKFLPIFLCSALYGPLWGGLCGGITDVLAYFVNSGGGPFMYKITAVEILYGLSYGFFFYKASSINFTNITKLVYCVLINTIVLGIFVMSYILTDIMGMSYLNVIYLRIPSCLFNMVIHFFGIFVILKFMPIFKRMSGV